MAKYITRTITEYNTVVTYYENKELHEVELTGELGKKESKKKIFEMTGNDNIIVVSVEKKAISEAKYRLTEEDFINIAERVL